MNDEKAYDLIFSIGEACSCSSALRNSKLQNYSYPFDWLYGCTFETRVKFLTTDFENFLEFDNLETAENTVEKTIYKAYRNKKNAMVFNHDFLSEEPFSEAFLKVKEKYSRRINRLINQISQSEKVLLVLVKTPEDTNAVEDNVVFEEALKSLAEKFVGVLFDILILENNSSLPLGQIRENNLSSQVKHLSLNYKSLNKRDAPYVTNEKALKQVFSNYKLTDKFKPKKSFSDFIEFKKLKRGVGIYVLKNLFNVLRFQLLLLGIRIDFCLGKIRE